MKPIPLKIMAAFVLAFLPACKTSTTPETSQRADYYGPPNPYTISSSPRADASDVVALPKGVGSQRQIDEWTVRNVRPLKQAAQSKPIEIYLEVPDPLDREAAASKRLAAAKIRDDQFEKDRQEGTRRTKKSQ